MRGGDGPGARAESAANTAPLREGRCVKSTGAGVAGRCCWSLPAGAPPADQPVGAGVREGLVQAGEGGDHTVNGGEFEHAQDGSGGADQQQLATFALGSLVRGQQDMQPGRVAEPGRGHVQRERPVPVRACLEQGQPQRRGVGDVDLLRCRHDRHAADQRKGKLPSRICVTSCGREHDLRRMIAAARQVTVAGLPVAEADGPDQALPAC